MSPQELQRRLRALPGGSSLSVKRDSHFARLHKLHPDAWQIWDKGHTTGRPIFVLSCELERTGGPCELDDRIVNLIARSFLKHGGRKSWIDELEREVNAKEEAEERARHQQVLDAKHSALEPLYHRAGHFKHWALDGTMKPCA